MPYYFISCTFLRCYRQISSLIRSDWKDSSKCIPKNNGQFPFRDRIFEPLPNVHYHFSQLIREIRYEERTSFCHLPHPPISKNIKRLALLFHPFSPPKESRSRQANGVGLIVRLLNLSGGGDESTPASPPPDLGRICSRSLFLGPISFHVLPACHLLACCPRCLRRRRRRRRRGALYWAIPANGT